MSKKPLKILIFSYDWRNDFQNNYEILIEKMKRDRLAPDFNDFFIISWSNKFYYKKRNNIQTYHFKSILTRSRIVYDFLILIFSFSLFPYLLRKRNFKPDIVLISDFPFALSGFFLKLFYKSKTVMLLGVLPSDLAQTRKFGKIKLFYQKVAEFINCKFIDKYIVITDAIGDYIDNLGVNKEKIRKINLNVIKRDEKFINLARRGKIKKKYNTEDNKKILLSVGRLEPEKGYEKLIDSFASLDRDDLILLIVGDGVLKNKLTNKIKEKNLDEKVVLAGWVSRKDIWNYYLDSDLFILLSSSEGLGLVFWEAMYMRLPVIGSRVGGIVDTIGDKEKRGFFWEVEDGIKDLNEKLNLIFAKDEKVIKMINEAKEYINKNIAVDYIVNDYLKK